MVHIDVKESLRGTPFSPSPRYSVNKDHFDSLDDVLERTVLRCNHLMSLVMDHPKFRPDPLQTIEQLLFQEKEKDQRMTPYFFGCEQQAPQFLVLLYLPSSAKALREFIKVRPEGFFFHHSYFNSLKGLILFFKENFRTEEYQQYLERTKPPFFDIDDQNSPERPESKSQMRELSENDVPVIMETQITIAQQYQSKRNDFNGENQGNGGNEGEDSRKSRPECAFCGKIGHSEDRCFKKNGKPADFVPRKRDNEGGGTYNSYNNNRSNTDSFSYNKAPIEDNTNTGWGDSGGATTENTSWAAPKPSGTQDPYPDSAWGGEGLPKANPQRNNSSWEKNDSKPHGSSQWDEVETTIQKASNATWGSDSNDNNKGNSSFNQPWKGSSDNKNNGSYGGDKKRSGGDSKRTCYKCNEEGHFAKECTKEGTSGQGPRGPKICFNCQEEGHMSRDCTKEKVSGGGGARGGPKSCNYCHKEGHIIKECPEKAAKGPLKCFNCNQEGHMSKDCTEPKKSRVPKCFNCEEEGHVSKDCTKERRPFCHNCKKVGHTKRECTEERKEEDNKPFCHNCKKVGHTKLDCKEERKEDNGGYEKKRPPYNNSTNVKSNNNNRSRSRERDGGMRGRGRGRGGFQNNNSNRYNNNNSYGGGSDNTNQNNGSGGWALTNTSNNNEEGGWGKGAEIKKLDVEEGGWGVPAKVNEVVEKKKDNDDGAGW